jgi:L-lactate dehydrogenase complex protein LldG
VSGSREVVLRRIRGALAGDAGPREVPRAYVQSGSRSRADVVALFAERLEEMGALVVRADDPGSAVGTVLREQGAIRVVVAPDLPAGSRPEGVEVLEDDGLGPAELDALDGALTTCAAACAETGTIAFDGGEGQGRRAITLVPDLHVCVVREEQIVETVPELIARLAPSAREGRPIVLVSGPSATSDIELERVEGVHGPRRLVVVLVEYRAGTARRLASHGV